MDDDRKFAHDMKNLIGIVLGYSNLLLDEMPPEDPRRTDIEEIRKAAEQGIALLNEWNARRG